MNAFSSVPNLKRLSINVKAPRIFEHIGLPNMNISFLSQMNKIFHYVRTHFDNIYIILGSMATYSNHFRHLEICKNSMYSVLYS